MLPLEAPKVAIKAKNNPMCLLLANVKLNISSLKMIKIPIIPINAPNKVLPVGFFLK